MEAGNLTFREMSQRDAAYERMSSSERGSGAPGPRARAIVTGKNVRSTAMMMTAAPRRPAAAEMIGASATIGIAWLAMTYGMKARSDSAEWTKIEASITPMSAPIAKPRSAIVQVEYAAPTRCTSSDVSELRWTGSESA